MEKKKNKRSQIRYSSLDPTVNLKTRYELIADYDYLDQLSDKEKALLNKFTKEYVNADLDTKNTRKNLHRTKKMRKDCYDRNNARNRCIWTRSKASKNSVSFEDLPSNAADFKESEDFLLFKLDLNEKKAK